MAEEALVLGGGGVAGIAWTTGLLAGLADRGTDVTGADLLVGTSAGSAVAAQLGSGLPLGDLYARQTEPSLQAAEIAAELDLEAFAGAFGAIFETQPTYAEVRRAIGEFALAADTVPEADRRAAIASRLPSPEWPSRRILIVAVDAGTGEPRVFERGSGVPLVDAVAASCAVPGIWPPVTIEGRRYVDGGMRSGENADYAAGANRVLIVAPMGVESPFPAEHPLPEVIDDLRSSGTSVAVVAPDEASFAAMGTNPLDPGTRRPAAEAGRAQGRALTLAYA
ncbi:patatin-like phospholipase family protein [Amycolatopsis minnesotensis]|uniref:Patatin-like phospholipase family protein n=1 Tax=Amycolatopsis minnesotensis TaxID=337894 RepID=A0ABN2SMT0_9PSEU